MNTDFNLESLLRKTGIKSATELAKILDITPRTVSAWKKAGKISTLQAYAMKGLIHEREVKDE